MNINKLLWKKLSRKVISENWNTGRGDMPSNFILYYRNDKQYDWYQNYDNVKDIVTQFINHKSKILNIGCGNSSIFII